MEASANTNTPASMLPDTSSANDAPMAMPANAFIYLTSYNNGTWEYYRGMADHCQQILLEYFSITNGLLIPTIMGYKWHKRNACVRE